MYLLFIIQEDMAKNFVEELKWRGMLAQIMPGTEEYLQSNMVSASWELTPRPILSISVTSVAS